MNGKSPKHKPEIWSFSLMILVSSQRKKGRQKKLTDHALPDDKREAKHRKSSTLD